MATEGQSQSSSEKNDQGKRTSKAGVRDEVGETHCERVDVYGEMEKRGKEEEEISGRGVKVFFPV